MSNNYDVIVVGAGHAGSEAALAAARMGAKTLVLTISLDFIAQLPCNPAMGGPAKSHLIREIDALGGEIGKASDACAIQMRKLNTSKGPAVQSLRAQIDRVLYLRYMKRVLEDQENLDLKQGMVEKILFDGDEVSGVETELGLIYQAPKVILATGTFLNGKLIIGEYTEITGPDGMKPSLALSDNLHELKLPLRRFKTGTPARVAGKSLDFSKMIEQKSWEEPLRFSFEGEYPSLPTRSCWLTYTSEKTHQIIRDNIDRAPMFIGGIEGPGPRYCPSIEDKIMRFADKERHQLFLEPTGLETDEYYVQGMATSLPIDVQMEFYRSIPGLENVEIMRPGCAMEYDCLDPTELTYELEIKSFKGLYSAGQLNGTSGYEEAAAQGMMAGINAVLALRDQEPFHLTRSQAYIGVLIDDLITKGTNEPYRLMTARSEYRLLLRQDNADRRLTEFGYRLGLISEERYQRFKNKMAIVDKQLQRLEKTFLPPSAELNQALVAANTTPLEHGASLTSLLRRPQLDISFLRRFDSELDALPLDILEQIEIETIYAGYIRQQSEQVERQRRMESALLPEKAKYEEIRGISREAAEKLDKIKPRNIGQASRISGVSPADISVLTIWLEQQKRKRRAN